MTKVNWVKGWLGLGLVMLLAVLMCGCGDSGGKGALVKGKIVMKGSPLPILPVGEGAPAHMVDSNVEVKLVMGQSMYNANADADGNFSIPNVAPGEYRLGVTHMPRPGMGAAGVAASGLGGDKGKPTAGQGGPGAGGPEMKSMIGKVDKLEGKFEIVNSKITVKVADRSQVDLGTIDLADPKTEYP